MGPGQVVNASLRLLCQLVHGLAARIGQAQDPGRLVEALTGGIVPGGPENFHIRVVLHIHDKGVAPGDGQGQKGRLQVRKGQVIGGDMAPDMVYRDQGHTQAVSHALGKAHRHQHRADKARGVGHGHRVNVLFRKARVGEGPIRQAGNGLHMLARGNLRHHAAIEGVHIRLGEDGIGEHCAPIPHHRHGGLVAGGFKGQNIHASASP